MAWASGMKNSIAETESDKPPRGAPVQFGGPDGAAEQTVKPQFLGQNPAHDALRAGDRAFIGPDSERMMHTLPEAKRGPQSHKAQQDERQRKARNCRSQGHATMIRLASLTPKSVPGDRPLKNDSESFLVSAAASGSTQEH